MTQSGGTCVYVCVCVFVCQSVFGRHGSELEAVVSITMERNATSADVQC